VDKRFGGMQAVDGVDLCVPAGSIIGLIGPSGCGKTTLLRILVGAISADDGQVSVLGRDPCDFTAEDRRRFGYQAQSPVLFPHLSLWGNLAFVAALYGVPLLRRRRRMNELLDFVELRSRKRIRLSEASGGMQRRLALAATLVHDPELIFLDEPTAGVDPILRERFWSRFRELRDDGRTLVVSTQFVGEASNCDAVAVMTDGRLITVASPDQLRQHAYGGDVLDVRIEPSEFRPARTALDRLPTVQEIIQRDDRLSVVVPNSAADAGEIEGALHAAGLAADVVPAVPDEDEVFVRLVRAHRRRMATGSSRPRRRDPHEDEQDEPRLAVDNGGVSRGGSATKDAISAG
jgi:ABC-2 type transport system ATP-binding protein